MNLFYFLHHNLQTKKTAIIKYEFRLNLVPYFSLQAIRACLLFVFHYLFVISLIQCN